jgi:peptidoglycan/xylan/chitin deacetylase (PgdA/CDA1 family)
MSVDGAAADERRQSTGAKRIEVVFRLDDYSARSSLEAELRIIDLFRRNRASITFGVIPCLCARNVYDPAPQEGLCLDDRKGEVLRNAAAEGVVEVALHGYAHQTHSAGRRAEFAGLDYGRQVEKLAAGRALLEKRTGARITTFIPPWNQYDGDTVRALEELGFSTLSASLSLGAAAGDRLGFLPETCGLPRLRRALAAARKSPLPQPVIVAAFHLFEILEVDRERGRIRFGEFAELVDWLGQLADVRLASVGQAAAAVGEFGAERLLRNRRLRSRWRMVPLGWRPASHDLYH